MVDWDDFEYKEPAVEGEPDEYEVSARNALAEFFEANSSGVFFGNQLAVQNEDRFFHWITYRAIADLIEAGLLLTERRKMAIGSEIKLVWHRKHRYYKRDAKRVVDLVDEYGSPNICAAMGLHGEQMILAGFARKQFIMRDHNTRRVFDREWIETEQQHELISRGGYAMILKYQLYPWTHIELARRVARELAIPVDAPKALAEGTMNRFEAWHRKNK